MPAVEQGEGKLFPRPATAGDLAIRSRYFRSKVSLLSGSHEWHITLASKMSCSIANFAKGSRNYIKSFRAREAAGIPLPVRDSSVFLENTL